MELTMVSVFSVKMCMFFMDIQTNLQSKHNDEGVQGSLGTQGKSLPRGLNKVWGYHSTITQSLPLTNNF